MVAFLCVGAKPLETKKKKYREGEAICLPLTAIINSTSQQLSRSDLSLSLSLSSSNKPQTVIRKECECKHQTTRREEKTAICSQMKPSQLLESV
jgi:hypothetical protein